MELTHRFSVPVGVDEAWAHFNDISSVAECFPGATVTSADADSFAGSVKVKLGPIALVYNGSGTFTEKDAATHRMVVDAKGKDKRGNGTAGAVVTMTMTGAGSSTDVEVLTDLAITGKPAQFGRGVMQDVSDKLLGQFVACLEQRFVSTPTPPAAEPEPTLTDEAAPVAAEIPPPMVEEVAPPLVEEAAPPLVEEVAQQPSRDPVTRPAAPRPDDSLNLGATLLPVLVRTYWKHTLALLVVVVLLIWLVSAM